MKRLLTARRLFSTTGKDRAAALARLPWNFDAVPERREVSNLVSFMPVNYIIDNKKASCLFKDYIDSVVFNLEHDDDVDTSMLTPEMAMIVMDARLHVREQVDLTSIEFKIQNW